MKLHSVRRAAENAACFPAAAIAEDWDRTAAGSMLGSGCFNNDVGWSERELQGELDNARAGAEAQYFPEIRGSDIGYRIVAARVIQHIKEVGMEL